MELFRGDSYIRKISSNYTFKVGDKLHIAILKNAHSENYLYETTIDITKETNEVTFEILPSDTSKLPVRTVILEIELTTIDGIVKTNQYELTVKADGIYERN